MSRGRTTAAELGVLLERARDRLVDPAQEMFDFEVEAVPPTARLLPAPAEATLLDEPGRRGPVDRAGTGWVVGTAWWPHMSDDPLRVLIELGEIDHRLLDPEHTPP